MNEAKKAERRSRGLYWDRAWKLVEGCTKVSAGCDNCWSETETGMRSCHTNPIIRDRARQVTSFRPESSDPSIFDGRITMRTDNLNLPRTIRNPTVFAIWNDLYHEDATDEFRAEAYQVMNECPQHTFLILTKRASHMAEIFQQWHILFAGDVNIPPNVWHGVSVENQEAFDTRVPSLRKIPGKIFISFEPLIGPVDVEYPEHHYPDGPPMCCAGYDCGCNGGPTEAPMIHGVDAVLLGGESGSNARPLNPKMVRYLRDVCSQHQIPFTFKQWGEWVDELHPTVTTNHPQSDAFAEINEAGDDYRGCYMFRVGKKKAGREIDGKIYQNLPWDKESAHGTD